MVREERKKKAASGGVVEVVVYDMPQPIVNTVYRPTHLMFPMVAEAESTRCARKPVEVSQLLIANGPTAQRD